MADPSLEGARGLAVRRARDLFAPRIVSMVTEIEGGLSEAKSTGSRVRCKVDFASGSMRLLADRRSSRDTSAACSVDSIPNEITSFAALSTLMSSFFILSGAT